MGGGLALADFGRDVRSSDSRKPDEILFVSSDKQCMIPRIFCRPNFTKFEYNTLIGVAMKTFGTQF